MTKQQQQAEERRAKVRKLVEVEKLGNKEIAARLGVSRDCVSQIRRELGIPSPRTGRAPVWSEM